MDDNDYERVTSHCTLGALEKAQNTLGQPKLLAGRAYGLAQQAIAAAMPAGSPGKVTIHIPAWNDADMTTEGDVLDVLRHAAKDLRNSVSEETA